MEGYQNSYQNSSSARETEFQRLAQNIGTNIQKIQQNGKYYSFSTFKENENKTCLFSKP